MREIAKTKTPEKPHFPSSSSATNSSGLKNDLDETRALFDAMMNDHPKELGNSYFEDGQADLAAEIFSVLFGSGAFA